MRIPGSEIASREPFPANDWRVDLAPVERLPSRRRDLNRTTIDNSVCVYLELVRGLPDDACRSLSLSRWSMCRTVKPPQTSPSVADAILVEVNHQTREIILAQIRPAPMSGALPCLTSTTTAHRRELPTSEKGGVVIVMIGVIVGDRLCLHESLPRSGPGPWRLESIDLVLEGIPLALAFSTLDPARITRTASYSTRPSYRVSRDGNGETPPVRGTS
ncbi:hypothetical protein BO70DRAFT_395673 [Aspergillus heteromorphus CBS 117.55]|uniref:Uncharacterized protein n=1 Tax=Aspergillus heteromorphus CBS 117.55 TaxID=1448321 RepID=A0A317WIJ7_9EURO|nr:uncharacterized protein BO70DRAFT_395673 [Aspergillus heteromorphus CBS 117.55]PWY84997.1 hypothetical protein BO70DRAFT_395673 [Aspergillus heteromorphus CBS 117.55]